MPVRVSASQELSFILLVLEGVVTADEIERYVAPLLEQPEYALMQRALADMSAAARGDAPSEILRRYARRAAQKIDGNVERGSKMALVAENPEFFGLSRMYQSLRGGSPVEFEIFRSRGEAEAWLELPDGYEEQLTQLAP